MVLLRDEVTTGMARVQLSDTSQRRPRPSRRRQVLAEYSDHALRVPQRMINEKQSPQRPLPAAVYAVHPSRPSCRLVRSRADRAQWPGEKCRVAKWVFHMDVDVPTSQCQRQNFGVGQSSVKRFLARRGTCGS